MKKVDKVTSAFNGFVAINATILTYLFGGWDTAIIVLIAFMILDYLTGVLYAYHKKRLSSDIGSRGLTKKLLIVFILMAAVLLDNLIINGMWVFRTLVCSFYIANEGLSLLENASNLGLPIPQKLKDTLIQLKSDKEIGGVE